MWPLDGGQAGSGDVAGRGSYRVRVGVVTTCAAALYIGSWLVMLDDESGIPIHANHLAGGGLILSGGEHHPTLRGGAIDHWGTLAAATPTLVRAAEARFGAMLRSEKLADQRSISMPCAVRLL
jgi:hypothetical protein